MVEIFVQWPTEGIKVPSAGWGGVIERGQLAALTRPQLPSLTEGRELSFFPKGG